MVNIDHSRGLGGAAEHPVLAWDIGGTSVKLGWVQGGGLLARTELAVDPGEALSFLLERAAGVSRDLAKDIGAGSGAGLRVGMAFPGIIEPRTGRILSTPKGKFDDAAELDVLGWLRNRFGWEVVVNGDANAALAGEWRFGAAVGVDNVVMMTLGTGIGTSVIVEGRPLRGVHGQAGILGGHLLAKLDGDPCSCGALGCVETEGASWSLARRVREHPDYDSSVMAALEDLDYAGLFRCAAGGDRLAVEVRDASIRAWSAGIVSLVHAYDPELVLLGGGVMGSADEILPRVVEYVGQHAWTPWGRVRVKAAQLGNDAGLMGAAWLASGGMESNCER